jgi:chromosomal replication initiation ATPase DnaA
MLKPLSYNERLVALEGEVQDLRTVVAGLREERDADLARGQPPKLSEIIESVCDYYNVTVIQITGAQRARHITIARMVTYFLARKLTGMSLSQVGKLLGDRDHTTIWHGAQRVQILSKVDEVLRDDLDVLELRISEKVLNRGSQGNRQVVHKLPVPA